MRCKKHLSDLSSSVGVCASCLRERLFALIVAQTQAQQQAQAQAQHHHHLRQATTVEDRCKQDPPPLIFPRSVSPYVTRRKSDDTTTAAWSYHHRFYSTPQVGPTYNGTSTFSTTGNFAPKKRNGKFSLFLNLFRSRSDKYNSDPRDSCESSSSSPSSWLFSTIFPSRRKKKSTVCYIEDSIAHGRRDCRISNRGMSPAREMDSDEDCDRSPWGSGDSTDEWRRTPMAAPPSIRRTRTAHSKNVSGLAFCLSPLVRASPNRQWNQKGGLPPDLSYTGELRAPVKPHLSTAASFCANRSRKLADFGRVNHNR
ncbi:vitellogenin-like [Melia azedarach]|uniref:Vitellogenin-like n=1 Tax=Melia azedarach TaxID=155640 RepID=A0ACC1YVG6_MELAZ|nr:vitellogenin-like [Melia azedarach]